MSPRKEDALRTVPALDLGHERVGRFLGSVMRGRVPSLLFSGPEGSGKEYTAIEFARRLCCSEVEQCVPGTPGICDSCAQAAALEQPGIQLIYPTPTQGSGEGSDGDVIDIARVLDDKRQDIFAVHEFKKKASVRIARARAVIQRANTRPFGSPYHVFIFVDAHKMREEAQNALLKVVEEPPAHSVMIFVTDNPESILYTIRSRCQHVRFAPLKTAAVERILTGYYKTDGDTARRAARLSHGNLQRARALTQSIDGDGGHAATFVKKLDGANESWVIGQALAVGGGGNRDAVARYLHELTVTFRDVMSGDESLMINGEQAAALNKVATAWDRKRIPGMIDRISRARHEILVRNMNIDATLVSLFLDLHRSRSAQS